MKLFISQHNYIASQNTIAGEINLSDYTSLPVKNAFINLGGWQSWNPGFEIAPEKKQPSLTCHLIHQWNHYLTFPGTKYKPSKNIVLAQFITYFRWKENNKDFYIVLASCGNLEKENLLPPVQFVINRSKNTVLIELSDKNKKWNKGEVQAKIEVITGNSMEECRQKLEKIFGSANKDSPFYSHRFDQLSHFDFPIFGWESWYNHYANINQELILKDLDALKKTENLISLAKAKNPVFQIDDGWEEALGDWDFRKDRFPASPEELSAAIKKEGFIPGIWIAPFIIDARSKTAQKNPHWLLKDKKGKLVPAGFNPLWGKNGTFYALDLSQDEVINHITHKIKTIINVWGFKYLKLDFLYAGMLEGQSSNNQPAYINYIRAINSITEIKQNNNGEPVCYLGCGVPFELSYNYLPLSRIGCDTFEHWENKLSKALNWNGRNSAYLNLQDTIGHELWNKIVFANDPDVLFIRKENCSLTKEQKLLIAKNNFSLGCQIMFSDDPTTITKDDIELTKEILNENLWK